LEKVKEVKIEYSTRVDKFVGFWSFGTRTKVSQTIFSLAWFGYWFKTVSNMGLDHLQR